MYNKFGGHGTIRDENNVKRRIHAIVIRYKVVDGLRVPVMEYREHDEFARYEGGWNNPEEALEIFKDIRSLGATLAGRTLGQTDFIRTEMKLVEAKMAAVLEQLKKSQAMVAGPKGGGSRQQQQRGGESSGYERLSSTKLPKFFEDLFNDDHSRWDGVPQDVHSIKNPAPFTAVSLPTSKHPEPIPAHGQKILDVLSSDLDTSAAILSSMEPEEETASQAQALHKLKELVCTKAPEFKVAIAKLPKSTTGVYLHHQGKGPPSRTVYDPAADLVQGQVAVVYTELSTEEKAWMGEHVSFSLIRVDEIIENGQFFHGTYLEPSARTKHYLNQIPWPEPDEWMTRALVALQVKTREKGRIRNVDYQTDRLTDGIPLDTVQFSFTLSQSRLIPKKFRLNVKEAIQRCNSGAAKQEGTVRVCDGIDENDGDDE